MLLQAEVEDVMILIARSVYFQFRDVRSIILENRFDPVICECQLALCEPAKYPSFQDISVIEEACQLCISI